MRSSGLEGFVGDDAQAAVTRAMKQSMGQTLSTSLKRGAKNRRASLKRAYQDGYNQALMQLVYDEVILGGGEPEQPFDVPSMGPMGGMPMGPMGGMPMGPMGPPMGPPPMGAGAPPPMF